MSYKKVLCQCLHGDWYGLKSCPRDGLRSATSDLVFALEESMRAAGKDITIENLVAGGMPAEFVDWVMVVEVAEKSVIRRLYFQNPAESGLPGGSWRSLLAGSWWLGLLRNRR